MDCCLISCLSCSSASSAHLTFLLNKVLVQTSRATNLPGKAVFLRGLVHKMASIAGAARWMELVGADHQPDEEGPSLRRWGLGCGPQWEEEWRCGNHRSHGVGGRARSRIYPQRCQQILAIRYSPLLLRHKADGLNQAMVTALILTELN